LILFVWPVGLLGGDDDGGDSAAGGNGQGGQQTRLVGQVVLEPRREGSDDAGLALVTRTGDQFELALEARLTPTKRNQAYEVWLYNSRQDAVSLGAQVTDDQGAFAGRAALPDDWKSYEFVDISRERVDRNAAHSGTSVLRGEIADVEQPVQQQQQQQGGNSGADGGDGG
ncbi:MAG: anti-sigma factor, partial [Solirubrobacterales bacterium]|nr:anti-sigma factor [Solirubrobacterales bacterium]